MRPKMGSRLDNLSIAIGFALVIATLCQIPVAVSDNGAGEAPTQAEVLRTEEVQVVTLVATTASRLAAPTSLPAGLPSPTSPDKATAIPKEMPYVPPASPQSPARIIISSIDLDAPVVPAKLQTTKVRGREVQQWLAPREFAAGWHTSSARLGESGNTVLNGHHNIDGEVFARLVDLEPGDRIVVDSEVGRFTYMITNHMILPEKYEGFDVRMENARWILPSDDERLTLITCWPYESNTHRLIIVATPLSYEPLDE